ncbi:holo-ACP synthase [Aristophania vespae]|uniref:Holo-[acyl-carrier-protein] synthase n=1 Tax=Aristophania vespae TaxID=2697033 RepID=A0A6P1NKE6_9PROT|nr:holo-ACP synthase [Aristophania vespae]QHI95331.1 holo-ACP synthase [Aristophania vespae]UMM64593.1 Holo-[acyl-carrier-protein] synthase [Aristophania vespae]
MILGIGADICLISRIEKVIKRHGDLFLKKIFLPEERLYVDQLNPKMRLGGYAKRWAAKEACTKALGTGFTNGVHFHDILVTRQENGAPGLVLQGAAAKVLEQLVPKGHEAHLLLTLSDDPPFAMANVLIQALPIKTV